MARKEGIAAKFSELEKIAEKLSGDTELEEAVKLYEKGMRIAAEIREYLSQAEQKIRLISEGGAVEEKRPDELGEK